MRDNTNTVGQILTLAQEALQDGALLYPRKTPAQEVEELHEILREALESIVKLCQEPADGNEIQPLDEKRVREIVREMFEQMIEPAAARISESVKQMIESMDEKEMFADGL